MHKIVSWMRSIYNRKIRVWLITRQTDRLVDRLGMGIDPGIKKAVRAFRIYGLSTQASCEGHMDRALPYPWIDVGYDDPIVTAAFRQQTQALLDRFYANREKDLGALQIVSGPSDFRVQSCGQIGCKEDTISPIRSEIFLRHFRKEMDDFADFLMSIYQQENSNGNKRKIINRTA